MLFCCMLVVSTDGYYGSAQKPKSNGNNSEYVESHRCLQFDLQLRRIGVNMYEKESAKI